MGKNLIKKLYRKRLNGSVTAYVFILFGMSIILYLFGFTSMLGSSPTDAGSYQSTAYLNTNNNNTSIANPSMTNSPDTNPLTMIMNGILGFAQKNPLLVIAGIGGLIFSSLIGYALGLNLAVFYQYLIPILVLGVFLNFIVFPVNALDANLRHMTFGTLPVSTVLLMFFNLFFILAVIEYFRTSS